MYPVLLIAFAFLCSSSLHGQALPPPTSVLDAGHGRSIPVYEGFERLAPLFETESDTLHIINFWATWCSPCVKELPYFEELTSDSAGRPLRVTLVNLDFRKQLQKRLIPFIKKHSLKSEIVVLDDPNANAWINRVDSSWSGAIPATVFLSTRQRVFREQSFTRTQLHSLIDSLLDTPQ